MTPASTCRDPGPGRKAPTERVDPGRTRGHGRPTPGSRTCTSLVSTGATSTRTSTLGPRSLFVPASPGPDDPSGGWGSDALLPQGPTTRPVGSPPRTSTDPDSLHPAHPQNGRKCERGPEGRGV